jgi:DNA-binding NtrC family response regulator
VVDDDRGVRCALRAVLRSRGYVVFEAASAREAEQELRERSPDLAIVDYQLPDGTGVELIGALRRIDERVPILVLTGHASFELAVQAMKAGADNFLAKPVEPSTLGVMVQRLLDSVRERRREIARTAREGRHRLDPFAGVSPRIRALLEQAHQVLASHTPVLIQGETGTGKGVLARWLHEHGPRAQEAFVDINCAGLSRELLESELFGHERGAFTGAATSKLGLLEVAHRGTAFLDEIGEMDLALQPRLLKVVEEQRFRRVGDVRNQVVDLRLIAATNRDLACMARTGAFRADLYFRINTIQLTIPPVRERLEDVPALARQVAASLGHGLEFAPDALRAMQAYPWPGNLREMRNVIERALLLSGGVGPVQAAHLRFEATAATNDAEGVLTLDVVERRHVEHVLRIERGNVDRAAAQLGVSRSTLYQKLKRYRDADLAGQQVPIGTQLGER